MNLQQNLNAVSLFKAFLIDAIEESFWFCTEAFGVFFCLLVLLLVLLWHHLKKLHFSMSLLQISRTGWPTDWLTVWKTDWLAERLTDWKTDWLADWLTDWQTDRQTDWLTGWKTDWLKDWLTDRQTDRVTVADQNSWTLDLRFLPDHRSSE